MDFTSLQKKFERMGARLRLRELLPGRRPGSATIIDSGIARLNIVRDDQGEVFEIEATRKQLRDAEGQKSKFLCGHDERH